MELGLKDKQLVQPSVDEGGVGDWFADLIRIGHKKGLIFVHPSTRYALVSFDLKRDDIKKIADVFKDALRKVLFAEGVEEEIIARILAELGGIQIAKTNDASILASMTDMIKRLKRKIDSPEEFVTANNLEYSFWLNRIPILILDGYFSSEHFAEILRERYGSKAGFKRTMDKELSILLEEQIHEYH